MQDLEFLSQRYSCSKLTEPGPGPAQIKQLLDIALRAPDHAGLKPWRFIVMTGQGRVRLGDILAKAVKINGGDDAKVIKAQNMPMRAPLVITVIAKYTEHDKVPWIEQVQSAGCALFSMQQAALAMGFGGIWRTGELARDDTVREALSLDVEDEIVGYLYLGTQTTAHSCRKPIPQQEYAEFWD